MHTRIQLQGIAIMLTLTLIWGIVSGMGATKAYAASLPDGTQNFSGYAANEGESELKSPDGFFTLSASKPELIADEFGAYINADEQTVPISETVYFEITATGLLGSFELDKVDVGEFLSEQGGLDGGFSNVRVEGYAGNNKQFSTEEYTQEKDQVITPDFPIDYSAAHGKSIDSFRVYYTKDVGTNHQAFNLVKFTIKNAHSNKEITYFSFNDLTPAVTGTLDETAKTVTLTVPYGTNVTSLAPTITHTGASISPISDTTQDFTDPVTYTVTAVDSSTQSYTVTVKVAPAAPNVTANDATNVIEGLDTTMEYQVDSGSYVKYDGTNAPDLSGNHTVLVRVAADAGTGTPAGADKTLTFTTNPSAPVTPNVPIVDTPPATTGIDVLINGKAENIGVATTTTVDNKQVTTLSIDQKKLEAKLEAEGRGAVVTLTVTAKADIVVSELNGQMIKNMENNQAVLEIKTGTITYTLPARQINIGPISSQVGQSVALQDIKVKIEIAEPTAAMENVVENAAQKGNFTIVAPPISFTIKSTYGDQTIATEKFDSYVERTIAIPDGVDPSKITTGVVVDPDGTIRHVPTKIKKIDGKYYASINSLTNSTYALLWHPIEFDDVVNHWSKTAVNDMGSRMVIDGTGNGQFSPDRSITRAEFLEILVRSLGLKLENGDSVFTDVKASDGFNSFIKTARAYNLISGYADGSFGPNNNITREQAMTMISRAMTITSLKAALPVQSPKVTLHPYVDVAEASEWAISSIADSVLSGIVTGRTGTELDPKAFMTRAEVAVLIRRLLEKSNLI